MNRTKLIQLGWSQLAIVFGGLAAVLAVAWVTFAWDWQEFYYREFVVPRLETTYGFRCGHVKAVRGGTTYFEGAGIVSVDLNGRFSKMGVRPGDAPFEHHGNGFSVLFSALDAAERGAFASFDVVNAYDESAGAEGFRTIAVYPRVREVPVALPYLQQLRSPASQLTAVSVGSPVDDGDRELWLWDPLTGSRKKLYAFRRWVSPTWSADGNWLALTDEELMERASCVVIDVKRGQTHELTDALMELPVHLRPASSDRVECEIFGWVLDDPSRVAVIFRDLGAIQGERWVYDFYFDTRTEALVAAGGR